MYNSFFYFSILCLLLASKGFCQIKGYVIDADTQKPIEYVSVSLLNEKKKATFSDKNGFFSIELQSPNDTIVFVGLGYQRREISVANLPDSVQMLSVEEIESISVQADTKKNIKFMGDLRKPYQSLFFRNTNYSIALIKRQKSSNVIVSFVVNEYGKDGFIDKVLIKLTKQKENVFAVNPITKERKKITYKLPKYIRLRVVCTSVGADGQPDKLLTNASMIFDISEYKSQWLDISRFNVPFPKDGAFVGIQIIELVGEEDVAGVNIPLLFESKKREVKDFIFTPRGWIKSSYYEPNLPKEIIGSDKVRKQTFGFGIQASFAIP